MIGTYPDPKLAAAYRTNFCRTGNFRNQRAVWHDLGKLYGPHYSRIAAFFGVLKAEFTLADGRQGNACAYSGPFLNEIMVQLEHVSDPPQAAAWAALRMYQDKRGEYFPSRDPLRLTDRDRTIPERIWDDGVAAGNLPGPPMQCFTDTVGRTYVNILSNDADPTLSGYLANMQASYERLYPEFASSLALGGVIGAVGKSLEEVRAAWDEAYHMHSTPLEAAQALLQSNIFSLPENPTGGS